MVEKNCGGAASCGWYQPLRLAMVSVEISNMDAGGRDILVDSPIGFGHLVNSEYSKRRLIAIRNYYFEGTQDVRPIAVAAMVC